MEDEWVNFDPHSSPFIPIPHSSGMSWNIDLYSPKCKSLEYRFRFAHFCLERYSLCQRHAWESWTWGPVETLCRPILMQCGMRTSLRAYAKNRWKIFSLVKYSGFSPIDRKKYCKKYYAGSSITFTSRSRSRSRSVSRSRSRSLAQLYNWGSFGRHLGHSKSQKILQRTRYFDYLRLTPAQA